MRWFLLLAIFASLFIGCSRITTDEIFYKFDDDEANRTFTYLNHVRDMPETYGAKMGVDLTMYTAHKPLVWHETLAEVARAKAMDMAKRDYLSPITPDGYGINISVRSAGYDIPEEWYEDPKLNYFELVQGGGKTGDEVIIELMKASREHREKLLGVSEFNQNALDVGIGFVRAYRGTYRTYVSIIIAKHDF